MKTIKSFAVCFRCGGKKPFAPDTCEQCGFKPATRTDLAKSFILSTQFDVGTLQIGRTQADLDRTAMDIASGSPHSFDPREVRKVSAAVSTFLSFKPREMLLDLLKWLGPPMLLLAVCVLILYLR